MRDFDVKGSGGGRYPLTLDATGTLVDSEIFRATTPRFQFTTNSPAATPTSSPTASSTGSIRRRFPATRASPGASTASVDVNVTLRDYANGVTPESIDASGRVDMSHSTVGGIDIDTAVVDGMYQDRAGNLNQLVVDGPDIHVEGAGADRA